MKQNLIAKGSRLSRKVTLKQEHMAMAMAMASAQEYSIVWIKTSAFQIN